MKPIIIEWMHASRLRICNPKRGKESRIGRAGWYQYYAGYSRSLVEDALRSAGLAPRSRVLDPWNGSGTTTEVAAESGHRAFGFDLNPAMVLVAKARLLDASVCSRLRGMIEDILAKAKELNCVDSLDSGEPLRAWFTPDSAAAVRSIERAIQATLINSGRYRPITSLATLGNISGLAALFYVAAFRTLRLFLGRFRSANPTWLKQPSRAADRESLCRERLWATFRQQIDTMASDLATTEPKRFLGRADLIDTALSIRLPIDKRSVDAVISSPPYCTRIDYVKKTGPELALLGATEHSIREMRDQMLGTPTVLKSMPEPTQDWGKTCVAMTNRIQCHRSYASKSYYWKTYLQYFDGLSKSLGEIDRVLANGAKCILVVQDSYYKDLHIDLATITSEMSQNIGWSLIARADFPTAKTIVGINPHAMWNGNPRRAIETVLSFQKVV